MSVHTAKMIAASRTARRRVDTGESETGAGVGPMPIADRSALRVEVAMAGARREHWNVLMKLGGKQSREDQPAFASDESAFH